MKNLSVMNGCWNCIHQLVETPQDDGTHVYCNLLKQITRKEFYSASSYLTSDKKRNRIMNWKRDNSVKQFNICSSHAVDENITSEDY